MSRDQRKYREIDKQRRHAEHAPMGDPDALLRRIEEAERLQLATEEELALRSPVTFTCPECGMVSYNPNDAANSYCGNCHRFF